MNRSLRHTLLAAATVAIFGVSGVAFAKDKLETERDKASYLVGMQIGGSLQQIKDEIDLSTVFQAIETSLKGGEPLLSQEEAQQTDQALRITMMTRAGQQVPGMAPGSQPPALDRQKVGLMLGSYAIGPSLAPIQNAAACSASQAVAFSTDTAKNGLPLP